MEQLKRIETEIDELKREVRTLEANQKGYFKAYAYDSDGSYNDPYQDQINDLNKKIETRKQAIAVIIKGLENQYATQQEARIRQFYPANKK